MRERESDLQQKGRLRQEGSKQAKMVFQAELSWHMIRAQTIWHRVNQNR